MKIDKEKWATVIGYPNYKVSSFGRVKSLKNRMILLPSEKKCKNRDGSFRKGHLFVTLYNKNQPKKFALHRLVALHFIKNPDPVLNVQINHKDGNKTNNFYKNLEWCTNSENIIHAYRKGLINIDKKRKSTKKGKDVSNAHPIRLVSKENPDKTLNFETINAVRIFLGITHSVSIHQAIREPHRTVKGFYIESLRKKDQTPKTVNFAPIVFNNWASIASLQ